MNKLHCFFVALIKFYHVLTVVNAVDSDNMSSFNDGETFIKYMQKNQINYYWTNLINNIDCSFSENNVMGDKIKNVGEYAKDFNDYMYKYSINTELSPIKIYNKLNPYINFEIFTFYEILYKYSDHKKLMTKFIIEEIKDYDNGKNFFVTYDGLIQAFKKTSEDIFGKIDFSIKADLEKYSTKDLISNIVSEMNSLVELIENNAENSKIDQVSLKLMFKIDYWTKNFNLLMHYVWLYYKCDGSTILKYYNIFKMCYSFTSLINIVYDKDSNSYKAVDALKKLAAMRFISLLKNSIITKCLDESFNAACFSVFQDNNVFNPSNDMNGYTIGKYPLPDNILDKIDKLIVEQNNN